jgi:hypothetical protein
MFSIRMYGFDSRICAFVDFSHIPTDGCGFAQIYCRVSLQEALRRNAVRGDSERVPEKSVLRMSEKLEEPAPEVRACYVRAGRVYVRAG